MPEQDVNRLIQMLDDARARMLAALKDIDPNTPVYPEGGWLVRDIVGHVALWDEQVCLSLQAYRQGGEYCIPNFSDDEDAYNNRDVLERRRQSVEQVFADFEAARAKMKALIEALPPGQTSSVILCPWGSRHTIATMIRHMAEHELEHCRDIEGISRR